MSSNKTFMENIVTKLKNKAMAVDISMALERYQQQLGPEAQVEVTVDNGRAILTGEVPNQQAYYAVNRAAFYTEGVTDVVNRVTIRDANNGTLYRQHEMAS